MADREQDRILDRKIAALAEGKLSSKKSGASGRDRTTDTTIFSRMLYQLSYRGIAAARVR